MAARDAAGDLFLNMRLETCSVYGVVCAFVLLFLLLNKALLPGKDCRLGSIQQV